MSTVAATDNGCARAGAAYVFLRRDNTWSFQAYIKASNAESGDIFGHSVSLSGDTLAVVAREEGSCSTSVSTATAMDNNCTGAGAAYVYVRTSGGTTWSLQAYIKAPNAESDDRFGSTVSLSDDTLAVGAEEGRVAELR